MAGLLRRVGPRGLVILLVLIAVGVMVGVQYRSSVASRNETTLKSKLFVMRDALDEYQAARRGCPSSLQTLVDLGYLRAIPEDPMTRSQTTWRFERTATTCDVKSGALEKARDGSSYGNW